MTKDATEKKDKIKRLSPKEWAEAEALWEAGEMTGASLAAKFGVTEAAIAMHMKRKGVKRGSTAAEHKKHVAAAVTAAAAQDATVLAARIRETKEEHYRMATNIAKLTWAEVLKARENNVAMATITNNVKALDCAMSVLVKARMERYAVLGLDKEDDNSDEGLPQLEISELTAGEIEDLRNRDFNVFEDVDTPAAPPAEPDDELGTAEVVEES